MSSRAGKQKLLILLILSTLVVAAFTHKAANASITHDEAGTYLNFVDIRSDLWSCHSDPECWRNASNHLLNTWLVRRAVDIFGISELAIRLPNLLFLVLFLSASAHFFAATAKHTFIAIAGFGMVCLNPYVLDFFALARGYGMGLGAMMTGLFLIWHYFRTGRTWHVALAGVFSTIAVFCNLLFAASTIALFAALGGYAFVKRFMARRRILKGDLLIVFSVAIVCLGFLVIYFAQPVKFLSGEGEFLYGTSTFYQSWVEFVRDSMTGDKYLHEATVHTVSALFAGLVVTAIISILYHQWDKDDSFYRFSFFMGLFSAVLITFFFLNHWLMDAQFPDGRKSIIYGPPLALTVWLWLHSLKIPHQLSKVLFGIIAILPVWHLINVYNSTTYREWWYDASTMEMVHQVAAEQPLFDTSVILCAEWIFHPAAKFYITSENLPIALAPRENTVEGSRSCDFYYAHSEHADRLSENYVLKENFSGRLLFEHKDRRQAGRGK